MSVTRDEAAAALQAVSQRVQPHTDVVVVTSDVPGGRLRVDAVGSGLHLDTELGRLLVTCDHVVNKGAIRHFGPGRLAEPRFPDDFEPMRVPPADLVATNAEADLALLRGGHPLAEGKCAYPLEQSSGITAAHLSTQIGTASFILGFWGDKVRAHAYPDGVFYLEAPLYSGVGPLVEVHAETIVADMAEKDIFFLNTQSFEHLNGTAATGGRRDLSGISGSGLWMLDAGSAVLVGIVLGANPGSADEHLLRVAPVWVLRNWVKRLAVVG